jgi:hypothetical protein
MLKTQRHPTFERSDVDLLTKVKITLSEALTGFSRILLTHLDGQRFALPTLYLLLMNLGRPRHQRHQPSGQGD